MVFVTASFKNGSLSSELPVLSQISVHVRSDSLNPPPARVQNFKK